MIGKCAIAGVLASYIICACSTFFYPTSMEMIQFDMFFQRGWFNHHLALFLKTRYEIPATLCNTWMSQEVRING